MASSIENGRVVHVKTEVRPSAQPYTTTEQVVSVKEGLVPSDRRETHLDRYVLKETTRNRVNPTIITGRAQIGKQSKG